MLMAMVGPILATHFHKTLLNGPTAITMDMGITQMETNLISSLMILVSGPILTAMGMETALSYPMVIFIQMTQLNGAILMLMVMAMIRMETMVTNALKPMGNQQLLNREVARIPIVME
tara:strand:- start:17 stop:370 length:354 start_codon:yes stop_codon:yes gene_type:complete